MTRPARLSSDEKVWSASDLAGDVHQATDKSHRIREMFSAIAPRYDLNNRVHSLGLDQAWRRRAVKLAEVQPTDDVLDVACGTGDLTEAFAASGPTSVTGLDFSDTMLQIARQKSARRTRRAGAIVPSFVAGDAMVLPFEDGVFDIVSIAFGIRNVSDPAEAIGEFRRVLRPAGRVVILEFSEPSNRLLRGVLGLYTRHIMPITATILAGDRSGAYRYLPRSVATFHDQRGLAELMSEAGFDEVTTTPLTVGLCAVHRGVVPTA